MWGNPRLVQWDYGKEINVTLTDALLSLESLRFMLGGAIKTPSTEDTVVVRHTEEVVCVENGQLPTTIKDRWGNVMNPKATPGHPIRLINLGSKDNSKGYRTQITTTSDAGVTIAGKTIKFHNPKLVGSTDEDTERGDHVRIFWEEVLSGADTEKEKAVEVTISPDTFPGTYRIVGDTFMRSASTGKDEPFQFVINQAKVQSNVTLTLEAEGDPSTNYYTRVA